MDMTFQIVILVGLALTNLIIVSRLVYQQLRKP